MVSPEGRELRHQTRVDGHRTELAGRPRGHLGDGGIVVEGTAERSRDGDRVGSAGGLRRELGGAASYRGRIVGEPVRPRVEHHVGSAGTHHGSERGGADARVGVVRGSVERGGFLDGIERTAQAPCRVRCCPAHRAGRGHGSLPPTATSRPANTTAMIPPAAAPQIPTSTVRRTTAQARRSMEGRWKTTPWVHGAPAVMAG